jgi:hypothetical protein
MITPPKTVMAARTFCQVRVSIPTQMLITMAIIGWTYEYMLMRVGRIFF